MHALGYDSVRVGLKALIVRGTTILFNENLDREGARVYVLPGGGQDHGETQIEGLKRECREEIGVEPRVYDLAFTFELMSRDVGRYSAERRLFHQHNFAFWCDIPEDAEPTVGEGHDARQVGVAWLDINELDRYDIRPKEIAEWLQSDPSTRPHTLGTVGDAA